MMADFDSQKFSIDYTLYNDSGDEQLLETFSVDTGDSRITCLQNSVGVWLEQVANSPYTCKSDWQGLQQVS